MPLDRAERAQLVSAAQAIGVSLDDHGVELCGLYLELLEFWSRRINLVGEATREAWIARHIVDSMAATPLLRSLSASQPPSIADLGSGAGLPGVPLAIALRPARVVLVEPRRKRAHFLRAIKRELAGLAIEILPSRIEDLEAERTRSLDAVVTRAAVATGDLLAAASRLLRPGGLAIRYAGRSVLQTGSELALATPRFTAAETHRYQVPSCPEGALMVFRMRST